MSQSCRRGRPGPSLLRPSQTAAAPFRLEAADRRGAGKCLLHSAGLAVGSGGVHVGNPTLLYLASGVVWQPQQVHSEHGDAATGISVFEGETHVTVGRMVLQRKGDLTSTACCATWPLDERPVPRTRLGQIRHIIFEPKKKFKVLHRLCLNLVTVLCLNLVTPLATR